MSTFSSSSSSSSCALYHGPTGALLKRWKRKKEQEEEEETTHSAKCISGWMEKGKGKKLGRNFDMVNLSYTLAW